jgi:cation diffusion facilitator family transporter
LGKDNSTKVVYAALLGNVLVAISKFGAAALSGSSAMLTEAIHSTADTANQVLLLVGTWRSRDRADASHAFGYGMEVYFWTFVVAVIVLLAGGVASIWQGAMQIDAPEEIKSPLVSLGVLALSAVFEGGSLAVGYREYKRMVCGRTYHGRPVTMWRFIKLSKDPNLYESLLEDSAAMIGLGIAALGVLASVYLGALWADGAASIAIGVLLIATSLVIANATRSLISGESMAPAVLADVRRELKEIQGPVQVSETRTLHLGPKTVLVALTVTREGAIPAAELERGLKEIEERVRAVDSRIRFVYFRFD